MKASRFKAALALTIALSMTSGASGQSSLNYVVVQAHIDRVQNATDIFQFARDCSNDSICSGVISAISSVSGYPIDRAVAVAGALASSRNGEGSNTLVSLPDGYSYCTARFQLVSIVPRDDERASTLFLEGREENGKAGVAVETWTPERHDGGRSWVEGDLTVVGVRHEQAAAAYAGATPCYRVPDNRRAMFVCRGSGCEGQFVDRGRTVSTAPTGAGERRE
jgi:hypothetical protein